MTKVNKHYTFDAALELKDTGAVTADGVGQVDAVDRVLDLGAARADSRVIVDVSGIDLTTGDEHYRLRLQLSNTPDFSADVVNAGQLELGSASATGNSNDSTAGRYEMAFTNEVNGTVYRYARIFADVAGTSPSINYTAFVAAR